MTQITRKDIIKVSNMFRRRYNLFLMSLLLRLRLLMMMCVDFKWCFCVFCLVFRWNHHHHIILKFLRGWAFECINWRGNYRCFFQNRHVSRFLVASDLVGVLWCLLVVLCNCKRSLWYSFSKNIEYVITVWKNSLVKVQWIRNLNIYRKLYDSNVRFLGQLGSKTLP